MTDLLAVAAYGKSQSLTNEECATLYEWIVRLQWEPSLDRVDKMIVAIKAERRPAPMPPARTHEEWADARTQA